MLLDTMPHAEALPYQEQAAKSPFPDNSQALLEIHNLHYAYGKHQVLCGASLAVAPFNLCGLLGPNGAGKSTLFKCCLNILKPWQQGSISMCGVDCAKVSPATLARKVAYVPQDQKQSFPFSVRELVRMGRSPHMSWFSLSPSDKAKADQAMERVGIQHLAFKNCQELSGGQRQLVLIARALAQDTPLMLLDEPTAALDFHNQIMVWKTLRSIAEEGKALLVCCHDPNHILWFCTHVAVMHQGLVLAQGPPREVVNNALLAQIYGEQYASTHTPPLPHLPQGLPVVYPKDL